MPRILEAIQTNTQLIYVKWHVPVIYTHWPITKFKVTCYLSNQPERWSVTTLPYDLFATVNCLKKSNVNTDYVYIIVTAVNDINETHSQLKRLSYKYIPPPPPTSKGSTSTPTSTGGSLSYNWITFWVRPFTTAMPTSQNLATSRTKRQTSTTSPSTPTSTTSPYTQTSTTSPYTQTSTTGPYTQRSTIGTVRQNSTGMYKQHQSILLAQCDL